MAKLEYHYNQEYKNDFLENLLNEISLRRRDLDHKPNKKVVLFYDGFGLDNRGLVQIYLKALISKKFRLIYVTRAKSKDEQPKVMSIVEQNSNIVYHYSGQNMTETISWLDDIFEKNSFCTAFFYTTPWDASGVIAFEHLRNKCNRFQINLTDHAFWLGVNAFDYILEFRNYGAAISRDFRGINKQKILYLPYYPIVHDNVIFQGFPFEYYGKKIIFSGGAIYKTIDKKNTFYSLVEEIVSKHSDVIFIYASSDSNEQLENLTNRYQGQVFHVGEREDLISVLEKSYLYLNTYPISGALMLQYAAIAGCIPVTLRRPWDDDACGILNGEDELGEIFESFDYVVEEIDKLLIDKDYYDEKKKLLRNQVISENDFQKELLELISDPNLKSFEKITSVNTEDYIETFRENITKKQVVDDVINSMTKKCVLSFPDLLLKKIIFKIGDKI